MTMATDADFDTTNTQKATPMMMDEEDELGFAFWTLKNLNNLLRLFLCLSVWAVPELFWIRLFKTKKETNLV